MSSPGQFQQALDLGVSSWWRIYCAPMPFESVAQSAQRERGAGEMNMRIGLHHGVGPGILQNNRDYMIYMTMMRKNEQYL